MNNRFAGSDITFFVNGQKLGTTQAINAEVIHAPERELKNGEDLSLFSMSRGATLTCENIQINPEFMNKMIPQNQKFKVVATGYKYPRGNRLPKKKRIRNKWIKKYHREIVLDNCVIL